MRDLIETYKLVDTDFITKLIERGHLKLYYTDRRIIAIEDLYLDGYALSQINCFSKLIAYLRERNFFEQAVKAAYKVFKTRGEEALITLLDDILDYPLKRATRFWNPEGINPRPLFILLDKILTSESKYSQYFLDEARIHSSFSYNIFDCYSDTLLNYQTPQTFKSLKIIRSHLEAFHLNDAFTLRTYATINSCVNLLADGSRDIFGMQYRFRFQNSKVCLGFVGGLAPLSIAMSHLLSPLVSISDSGSSNAGVLDKHSVDRLDSLLEIPTNLRSRGLVKSSTKLELTFNPSNPTVLDIKHLDSGATTTQEVISVYRRLLTSEARSNQDLSASFALDSSELIIQSEQASIGIQNRFCSDPLNGASTLSIRDNKPLKELFSVSFPVNFSINKEDEKYNITISSVLADERTLTVEEFIGFNNVKRLLKSLKTACISTWSK